MKIEINDQICAVVFTNDAGEEAPVSLLDIGEERLEIVQNVVALAEDLTYERAELHEKVELMQKAIDNILYHRDRMMDNYPHSTNEERLNDYAYLLGYVDGATKGFR